MLAAAPKPGLPAFDQCRARLSRRHGVPLACFRRDPWLIIGVCRPHPSLRPTSALADTETLVRELRGSFDRVVLEPEFKQHISPVDNYQFFSVLLQTIDSARWHLNFNPQFVQAVQSNRSLVAHRLDFDVGRLCPEGI